MRIKNKLLIRFLAAMYVLTLFIGLLPVSGIEADTRIKVPKITVRLLKDKKGILITVNKTADSEGYQVFADFKADNSLYKVGNEYVDGDVFSYTDKKVTEYECSNTKLQKITLTPEDLNNQFCSTVVPGQYKIKVRAYNKSKFGTTVCGDFCKVKTLKVAGEKTGKGYTTKYDFTDVRTGDIITFGAYEQDGNFANGQEPVEWIVLNRTDTGMMVMSRAVLETAKYNTTEEDVTWEKSSLRKWMNSTFYDALFNDTEKAMISTVTVKTTDNAEYGTKGGKSTKDKLFALSLEEVTNEKYGFEKNFSLSDNETFPETRRISNNKPGNRYLRTKGYSLYTDFKGKGHVYAYEEELCCNYWLRSPGITGKNALYIDKDGIVRKGSKLNYSDTNLVTQVYGVRPALVISLDN